MPETRPGFTTDALVDQIHSDVASTLLGLPDGELAEFAVVAPILDGPNTSYQLETLRQGGRHDALRPQIWVPSAGRGMRQIEDADLLRVLSQNRPKASNAAVLAIIEDLNEQGTPYVILSSPETRELNGRVVEAVDPELDLDSLSSRAARPPITPEAIGLTADAMLHQRGRTLGALASGQIVVLGNGGVGGPFVADVLPEQYGITLPQNDHYRTREDLPAGVGRLAKDSNVVLGVTATLAAGNILEVPPGTTLVDFGYAIDPTTGKPCGNAHPDLVAQHGTDGRQILAFRRGGGPVTIAMLHRRAAEFHVARAVSAARATGNIALAA